MLELVKIKECDGACCKVSPRFPNTDKSDCIYRTNSDGSKGCSVMNKGYDLDSLPISFAFPEQSGKQTVLDTCFNYPHNSRVGRGTGDECCWQWVDV